jgi:hypothetical protein
MVKPISLWIRISADLHHTIISKINRTLMAARTVPKPIYDRKKLKG